MYDFGPVAQRQQLSDVYFQCIKGWRPKSEHVDSFGDPQNIFTFSLECFCHISFESAHGAQINTLNNSV